MSLFVASLNSGSNGNCYYIGNEQEAVLIDAGISCREIETRMARLGLSLRKVKAIFVSHEHTDHIRGIEVLSRKYRIPVYITPLTQQNGRLILDSDLQKPFFADKPINIGDLQITPFTKLHDAVHPHSFSIARGEIKVGVFTDIGDVCENLIAHFKQCHAAFLETNYDEELLENGSYPYHLKRRIRGGLGHLSNTQALALFTAHKPDYMTHVFLSHLSKDNNRPQLVLELFNTHALGTEIIIASRFAETRVYHITGEENTTPKALSAGLQFSLF